MSRVLEDWEETAGSSMYRKIWNNHHYSFQWNKKKKEKKKEAFVTFFSKYDQTHVPSNILKGEQSMLGAILLWCGNQRDLRDSRRRSSSTGLMNFSQSCVPLGTMRSSLSATTIASAYDRLVLFIVVMKSEPPGCTQREMERFSHDRQSHSVGFNGL